ncbi:hypothetical protein [Anoxynatronum buryatiense]|uniref:Uncharacterized protein n=1 Tax=Anoxynatronum buryatiense TaxID=489973 RepID=A0AA46AJX4_9CLOT|nr:hypothetical protein [Anoxynatronum buryatiense]SMP64117.1 hypothetical protein SAMN06296020_111103 [Anoxynatronum buryatiense]
MVWVILIIAIGCTHDPEPPPDHPSEEGQQPEVEASLQEEASQQGISDDGILHFSEGRVVLLAYEDEMNLEEILGTPLMEETVILENADTFTGSHKKTLIYQDTRLILFSPPQGGRRFYLINIETENQRVTTNRGIGLGHTLDDLMLAYPEVTRSMDGTSGTNGRYEFMFEDNPYTYLFFYIEEGKVVKLQLLHEFT